MKNLVELIEQKYNEGKLEDILLFIQKELEILLNKIKATNSIGEVMILFDTLEKIQFILAKAVFNDNLVVPPNIKKFIYDFDRIDDEEIRYYLYSKIKEGQSL